jgi:hypothetical protein
MKLLKEPLFHFIAAGSLLFVLSYAFGKKENEPTTVEPSVNIVVDKATVHKIAEQYTQLTGMPVSDGLLDSFATNYAYEEVLYREALKAGLDKSDATRTAMAAQMNTALKDMMHIPEPDSLQLKAFYAQHPEKFTFLMSREEAGKLGFQEIAAIVKDVYMTWQKELLAEQKKKQLLQQYQIQYLYKQP